MTYLFRTTATMKPHNEKKWWIDRDIVRNIYIDADSVRDALLQYQEITRDKYGVNISSNAIKNKSPMYIDTATGDAKQCGYVITAQTDFNDDRNYKWVSQYIDLWIDISIIQSAF